MSQDYPQIVRAIRETPWAIMPETLAVILDLVSLRVQGVRLSQEEIEARTGSRPARKEMETYGSVAVLPVYGVIVPKADLFSDISGGTSVTRLQSLFRDAIADENVSAVVFDIDSPGGQTDLLPEFAGEIRGARGKKPIIAVANTVAASAAYWLGSQADEFVATKSARVGSVGVFAAHADISGEQAQKGVKTTLVSAGKYKVEGNPFEPLSEEAREAIQARVDEAYQMFTLDVSRGRRVPVESVRSGYGEGRVLSAQKAQAEGMVDRIDTLEAVVNGLRPAQTQSGSSATSFAVSFTSTTPNLGAQRSFTDEAHALRESAEHLVERLTSLAEVRDAGRLTVAKRESLLACPGALREAAQSIEDVLTATDPDRDGKAFRNAVARFALDELRTATS